MMIYTVIVWILLIVVLVIIIFQYENRVSKHISNDRHSKASIPKFAMNLEFRVDPITNTDKFKNVGEDNNTGTSVGSHNEYDCNAKSLHRCDIDDATTLFGCRELMVKCQHFDVDTPYIDGSNEEPITIPRNNKPNEGYALAIRILADSCNPYHGDLVLVALASTSNEYMMICSCKNPGYVGNDHLLGNCSELNVCDGRVIDINKPLDELECACEPTEKNIRYDDGAPVCKPMTVQEANERYPDDWSHIVPWTSDRRTHRNNFNPTIRGNLRTRELLDPCLSSAHDTTIAIPNARRNDLTNECNFLDYGYPILNTMLDDIKWQARLPPPRKHETEKFDLPPTKRRFIGGALATGKYELIRFSDQISNIDRIYGLRVASMPADSLITKEASGSVVLVPPTGLSLGKDQVLNITATPKMFVAPKCENTWPTFACGFAQYYGGEYLGLPTSKGRPVPGGFLWSYEHWTDAEYMVDEALDKTVHNDGWALKSKAFDNMTPASIYGFQWSTAEAAKHDAQTDDEGGGYTGGNGVLVFATPSDFTLHRQVKT